MVGRRRCLGCGVLRGHCQWKEVSGPGAKVAMAGLSPLSPTCLSPLVPANNIHQTLLGVFEDTASANGPMSLTDM